MNLKTRTFSLNPWAGPEGTYFLFVERQRISQIWWNSLELGGVFARVENLFFSFDSFNKFNSAATNKILDVLTIGINCPSTTILDYECTQQVNSYDCGLDYGTHVLVNTENICHHFCFYRHQQSNTSDKRF